ncbi:Protein of unknown function [Pyronema omphalodes CBS 100304]|uniref:Uncharacterized protein n=1 Tax=Pyronema omphalodes (strain CBS 100304) TaxID=1076935 RepID=U4LI93_PYROM|nr:Protein of unknown function [Pyronema omphalodes CBS 100304]
MQAAFAELRSVSNVSAFADPATAPALTLDNTQPEDVDPGVQAALVDSYGTMVPDVSAAVIPRLDVSRLAELGLFLGSQGRTVAAATVVPLVMAANGVSAGAESQQEAPLPSENQEFWDGVSGAIEEKVPGLARTGEM